MNYFMRLADAECWHWRIWEVRAAILILAGYPLRCVAFAAVGALRRRGRRWRAMALAARWQRSGVLSSWRCAVAESASPPNDAAFVNRIVVQSAAGICRNERRIWASAVGAYGNVGPTGGGKDAGIHADGFRRVANGKVVRFSN